MIRGRPKVVAQPLEALWASGTLTGLSDAQLLSRFAGPKDATAESAFRELMHRSMIVVQSPDRTALQAMSLELDRPRWDKFQFPPGTTAQPLAGPDVAALMIKGKSIDRIAAFSPFTGNWAGQTLLKPVADELNPAIGPGWALYQAGNDFYAFSSRRGFWSVLHLEDSEPAFVATSGQDIEVMQGNRMYVFGLKQGEWSNPVEAYRPATADSPKNQKPAGGSKLSR